MLRRLRLLVGWVGKIFHTGSQIYLNALQRYEGMACPFKHHVFAVAGKLDEKTNWQEKIRKSTNFSGDAKMIRTQGLPSIVSKRRIAALLASSAVLTAGCANMATTATSSNSALATSTTIGGTVHGGNQPVQFATVQLFGVGQNGNGSPATLLATASTDNSGTFGFNKTTTAGSYPNTNNTYTCPSGADQLLYIKSTGGNTQGDGNLNTRNSAAVFLAPVGYCSQVSNSTFINISEVTTAAMVVSAAPYINPQTEDIGADGIAVAYVAINNNFNNVKTLVNQATGLANTSVPIAPVAGGLNVGNVTLTATPQADKLNTIANILSACVNQVTATSASNCSTLFSNATPPPNPARLLQNTATYPTATDTLQAALYMFLYPTDGSQANRTALFNLSPAAGAPYQPTLTAVPTDWTIGVSYQTANTCGNTANPFFSNPYDMSVDINGNLWLSNNASNGSLVEITNNGAAANCATLGTKSIAGGQIDIAGNIWYGDSVNNLLYRFTPSTNAIRTYTTVSPVIALTVDGAGNTFFTGSVNGVGSVYKIINGATINGVNAPVVISTLAGPVPSKIFPDNAGDVWVTSGAGYVTEVAAATGGPNFLNGYTSTQFSVPSPSYGVVVGPQNRIYVTSQDPAASLTVLAPSGATYAVQPGFPTPSNIGGLSNPAGTFIDGGQTSYAANNAPNSSTGLYGLALVALDGTEVSASGNANGAYQKSQQYFNAMRGIVVDSGGNVWVTNDNNPDSITEVIGVGVPIYAPYSTGLQNGRFQQRP